MSPTHRLPEGEVEARMQELLAKASTFLWEGLLLRHRRAMKKYFRCMEEYRLLLSQQRNQKSDLPTVEEYIAKLARTPSPVELEQQKRQDPKNDQRL